MFPKYSATNKITRSTFYNLKGTLSIKTSHSILLIYQEFLASDASKDRFVIYPVGERRPNELYQTHQSMTKSQHLGLIINFIAVRLSYPVFEKATVRASRNGTLLSGALRKNAPSSPIQNPRQMPL